MISQYIESDNNIESQFTQMLKQNIRKKLKQDSNSLEDLLMGDNIIGQLFMFTTSLMAQGMNLALQIKKMTIDKLGNEELSEEQ